MNNIDNIQEILLEVPYILEYFIPGFIFIRTFQIFTSRKSSDYQLILSVAISYVLKAICAIGHDYICKDISFPWSRRVIILTGLALLLSIIFVILSEVKYINKMFMRINFKSMHDDIWQDVIDYKNGTTLRFICEDVVYIGRLVEHEEKGNDSWFILKDYIIEGDTDYSAKDIPYPTKIAVSLKDVKRVELYYGIKEKSKFRKWLGNNKILGRFFKEQEN